MIVVTGGAGFIGSNLVAALASRGQEVVVCDWMGDDERWRNLHKHKIADLVGPDQLSSFLHGKRKIIETVYHLGAISSTAERNVDLLARQNIQPTLALLEWCTREGKPFIYASSAATYGDGAKGFRDDEAPEALATLKPLNAYGWSKHIVDRRVAHLKRQGEKLPPQILGLKFFNVFGPNEYHKGAMRSVIATNYSNIVGGTAVRLFRSRHSDYPDGGQLRDFIYVRDCVDVMLWLRDSPTVSGLFNVGTGQARSWRDMAKAMFAAANRACAIEWIDMPAGMSVNYQNYTKADIGKLRRAGYDRPFMTLEDGVRHYISNYLAKDDIYR